MLAYEMADKYRLRLKQLDFISLVDDPAQPNAKCLLIKRRKGDASEIEAVARLVKTDESLGLAFFWAFTSTDATGAEHFDLQGDSVTADDQMVKAAMEFMENGGAVDEMHDYTQTGRVVFAMPMTPEIASAFGVASKTTGLMIALKPSPEAMAKLKSGEYRAVSIAGLGEREPVGKSAPDPVEVISALFTQKLDELVAASAKSTRENESRKGQHTMIVLSEAQHAHYLALKGADAEAFANMAAADRDAVVTKAREADVVVFNGEHSGIVLRKSEATDFALKIAKNAEDNAKRAVEAEKREAIEKSAKEAEIEKAEIAKMVGDVLAGMPGDGDTHAYIVRSLRKGGDEVMTQKALETLKGITATSTIGKAAPGAGGQSGPAPVSKSETYAALAKGLDAYCAEQKITAMWTVGLDAFIKTAPGKALHDAHEAAKATQAPAK